MTILLVGDSTAVVAAFVVAFVIVFGDGGSGSELEGSCCNSIGAFLFTVVLLVDVSSSVLLDSDDDDDRKYCCAPPRNG